MFGTMKMISVTMPVTILLCGRCNDKPSTSTNLCYVRPKHSYFLRLC